MAIVLDVNADKGSHILVTSDYTDVAVEARFERGLEDFDHPYALRD